MKPAMHRHRHVKKKKKPERKEIVRVVLGIFLIVEGVLHFIVTSQFVPIIEFLPFHNVIIYLSGLIEIILGVLFISNKYRKIVAWGAVLFFLAVLPVSLAFENSPGAAMASLPWLTWGKVPSVIILMIVSFWYTRD